LANRRRHANIQFGPVNSPSFYVLSEITGYEERELISTDHQSITHPADLAVNLRRARRMYAGEIPQSVYETRYIRKDGAVIWVRNSVSLVRDNQEKPVNVIRMTEDITQRRLAEEAMHAANHRLRQLSTDLLHSQDAERRRIGRDLHDSTAQLLAGLSMTLSRVRDLHAEPDPGRALVLEAIELTGQCLREIRTLSHLLHPPLLEDLGLASALQTYAEGFRQRTGLQLEVRIAPGLGRLAHDLEITIFRIVQEGLGNIYRHSGSPSAMITLEGNSGEVCLTLVDRGRGLAAAPSKRKGRWFPLGVGIPGMRERAELLGGRLEISSNGEGSTVTVILPVRQANE
jgi:PAS domain S-box-containing protein